MNCQKTNPLFFRFTCDKIKSTQTLYHNFFKNKQIRQNYVTMRIPYRKPGPYSQIKTDPFITKAKFDELKNKLEKLKNFSRPKAAADVARLAELGDFSENMEYQMAKGRLRGINSAILRIENEINNAQIIETDKQNNFIQIGSKVTMESGGKRKTYQILGSMETDPAKGIISHLSALGSALMGRQPGEEIKVQLAGKEVEYKIIKIE